MNEEFTEKCEKTGLPKAYCAHCQSGPEYGFIEDTFYGEPIIELLYRGGPIHEFDEHFRFGTTKGLLILSCIDVIKELALAPEGLDPDIENSSIDLGNTTIQISFFTEFETSYGKVINAPWLRLEWNGTHIGIGRRKAKALYTLQKDIHSWIDRNL